MLKWAFGADTGPFRRSLGEMRSQVASFSDGIKGKLAGALGLAGIAAGFKKAISAASDLSETMSKSLAVFEGKAENVQKWSAGLSKSFGQSQASALAAATDFGAVFRVMGVGGDEAAQMSMRLTELASDMASFNNTSVEQALEAIGAGLRGESEPLRKYAVLLDDATLKAKALAMGIYEGSGPLTISQKLMAAYQAILTQTSLAQGDFAKTADGAANSQRIIAAETENAAAAMGGKLLPQWEKFLGMMKEMDIGPIAEGVGSVAAVVVKSLRSISLEMGAVMMTAEAMYDNLKRLGKGEQTSFFADIKEINDAIENEHNEIWSDKKPLVGGDKSSMAKATADAKKQAEEIAGERKKLVEEIAKLEEDARIKSLSLAEKILDAEKRRAALAADAIFGADETKALEARKGQLEVEKEIAGYRDEQAKLDEKTTDDKQKAIEKHAEDMIQLAEKAVELERENKLAGMDDAQKSEFLKKEREQALRDEKAANARGDYKGGLEAGNKARELTGQIDDIARGVAEKAKEDLSTLMSRGPTIATSSLTDIGGGGGSRMMESDYMRKAVDYLQIIAANTAGGSEGSKPPEPI